MKDLFKNKAPGFYATIVTAVLALVTAILYYVSYGSFTYQNGRTAFSMIAFVLLLAAAAANVLLVALKRHTLAPYMSGLLVLLSFACFIYGIYHFVSVMAVGIDARFNATFFINSALFLLLFVLGIANIFLKQEKA